VNRYLIWFDLADNSEDLAFVEALDIFLDDLRERDLIAGWRLARRKLGFGPGELGEFQLEIETEDLAQLERAFREVSRRERETEERHAAVFLRIRNMRTGLYRDFPDHWRR
jgi:hypothetical protein